MNKYRLVLALACAFMASSDGWAVNIAISNTQALAFGKFAAGSGGSVTVTPGGARSASGGVVLLASGGGTAAQFSVTGDANATYTITLPDAVTLASGGNSMAVNTFVSSPANPGTLSGSGTQTLNVGATLTVGANQPAGDYTGSFAVTVNYP